MSKPLNRFTITPAKGFLAGELLSLIILDDPGCKTKIINGKLYVTTKLSRRRIARWTAVEKVTCATVKESVMSRPNLAQIIYDSYPDSDLLPVDRAEHCKDMKTLYEHVRGPEYHHGDTLFRFIVVEAYEGGQLDVGTTIDKVDFDLAAKALERGCDDIHAVVNAIEKATKPA